MDEGSNLISVDDLFPGCVRCGRELTRAEDGSIVVDGPSWTAVVEHGLITGLRCPDCVTDEERAEAAVRDAMQGNHIGPDGRLWRWDLDD